MLCEGKLGGVIFFQDPMDKHPHTGDIESLLRSTMIYNVLHAVTPASALAVLHVLRLGLEKGAPEMIPSFFTTLSCPSVARYEEEQKKIVKERVVGRWKAVAAAAANLEMDDEGDDRTEYSDGISSRGSTYSSRGSF